MKLRKEKGRPTVSCFLNLHSTLSFEGREEGKNNTSKDHPMTLPTGEQSLQPNAANCSMPFLKVESFMYSSLEMMNMSTSSGID